MPVSSETDICNLALAYLGEARIQSLDDDTVSARACALQYVPVRDQVLRGHRWNFAQARATLSPLTDAPAFRWSKQYELPADCVRVLEINGSEDGDWLDSEYVIEGRLSLTDRSTVNLVYVRAITDVSQLDALFVEALSVKLAIKLCETIRGTTGKTAELQQLYERVTAPTARRVDANEGKRRKGLLWDNSRVIRSRFWGV